MSLAYVIVDEFTDTPLQGNQVAVFEDGSALSDDQIQRRNGRCPGLRGWLTDLLPASKAGRANKTLLDETRSVDRVVGTPSLVWREPG
jgi:hypothetical protein